MVIGYGLESPHVGLLTLAVGYEDCGVYDMIIILILTLLVND